MPLYGEAKRKYQREWRARRRQDWIDSQGAQCKKCGSTKDLEVDHIDPSKKTMHTRAMWSKSSASIAEELANCQVLCSDCHMAKTVAEIAPAAHGTDSKYTAGCRCLGCKAAHALAAKEWRASKKLAPA